MGELFTLFNSVSVTNSTIVLLINTHSIFFNQLADELYPDVDISASPHVSDPGPSHSQPIYTDADIISENASDATMEEIVIPNTVTGKGKEKMSFEEELARELNDLKEGKDIERFCK